MGRIAMRKPTTLRRRLAVCLFFASFALLSVAYGQETGESVRLEARFEGTVKKTLVETGDVVFAGDDLLVIERKDGKSTKVRAGVSGKVVSLRVEKFRTVKPGDPLLEIIADPFVHATSASSGKTLEGNTENMLARMFATTGVAALFDLNRHGFVEGWGRLLMYLVGLGLLYLGVAKKFEPLLLVPIAFGCLLSNVPLAGIAEAGGLLSYAFDLGIDSGVFPLLIFMGVGALTDFGPLIAAPSLALLGAAAQFGIFTTLFGALLLNYVPGIEFSIQDAAAIGIIGGADGPTSIFVAGQLSPRLLGSIAVAAYSYMALVPIIQPPVAKLLTTPKERTIRMKQLRYVSKREKIVFPLLVVTICALLLPSSIPLIGMLMFGNLLRETGVTERLSGVAQNALINIVTIFLGLAVGTKLTADRFLTLETVGILLLGVVAFMIGTASGVIIAKLLNRFGKNPVNPLIGLAGVSAVPMAARVANKMGTEADNQNFLLMHAMGPNVSGVIGSAVAAGILLTFL